MRRMAVLVAAESSRLEIAIEVKAECGDVAPPADQITEFADLLARQAV